MDPHDGADRMPDPRRTPPGVRRSLLAAVAGMILLTSFAVAEPAVATFPGATGRIAFNRPDNGGYDIFSMAPDGSDVQQLTHLAPDHSAFNASWSPDGSQIVFERVNARGRRPQVWIMGAEGSNPHLLFSDPWFEDHDPSFSPDGTKVLFSRCQSDPDVDQGRCAVATVNIDGTGIALLTKPQAEELVFWPVYSPDGSQIAFSVFYGRGVRAGIFVMDADGSDVRLVTPAKLEAWIPSWAPDGSRLVFTTHCCDGKTRAIGAVNPDGTGLTRITDPGDLHDFQPVFSPDGTQIAFERDSADYSRYGLYTMNPDGTGITRILGRAWDAAWQPIE
jgi:Tol biopolymer transport system component